jgi:N6-adenosine-specific RNA methylase IME4
MPVREITADDAVLFLWTTGPHLEHAFEVIKEWGFEYKSLGFVWVKKSGLNWHWGMGFWTRANAELCLLATKGNPKRISGGVHQIICTQVEEHSKKPGSVRDRIVELLGDLPRIELFARERATGWDVFGNEVESDVVFDDWPLPTPKKADKRTLESISKLFG